RTGARTAGSESLAPHVRGRSRGRASLVAQRCAAVFGSLYPIRPATAAAQAAAADRPGLLRRAAASIRRGAHRVLPDLTAESDLDVPDAQTDIERELDEQAQQRHAD